MPENRKPQTRLDPRKPLVLDTRELGRRPGSMRRLRFAAPAPVGLGLDLIGVPAGAELDLDLRLEAVMEGVLVSGSVEAPLVGECGRCLDPVEQTLEVSVQQLYSYDDADVEADEDDDTGRLEGDLIDFEPAVRDAVVLALPLSPLCSDDCAGLCPGCGGRWDELPEDHTHDQIDPRWAGLQTMLDDRQTDSEN